jgi:protein translocase SecG subunit
MILVAKVLPYVQIILSVILITAVLLQQSAAGMGGAMGGSDAGSSFHHTRRGFEKFLFYLSIVCGILFALFAFLSIIIKANS